MNRFRPLATRACLEDLTAPIGHFAACRQDHDFMYRQLAQTHRHASQMDPSFWSRTENVWAGTSTRTRASFAQLVTGMYGRCIAATAVVLLIVGLQFLPASTSQNAPVSHGPSTVTAQAQADTSEPAPQRTARGTSSSNTTKPSGSTAASSSTQSAPAAPTQPTTAAQTATEQPAQTPQAPGAPSQTEPAPSPEPTAPTQPAQTGTGVDISEDQASVSLLTDEEPTAEVALPGVGISLL